MNSNDKVLSCLGQLVLAVAILVVTLVISGWAIFLLWGWFIVPMFSVSEMSIAQAMGISLFVALFIGEKQDSDDKQRELIDVVRVIVAAVFRLLCIVFLGWIIVGFM